MIGAQSTPLYVHYHQPEEATAVTLADQISSGITPCCDCYAIIHRGWIWSSIIYQLGEMAVALAVNDRTDVGACTACYGSRIYATALRLSDAKNVLVSCPVSCLWFVSSSRSFSNADLHTRCACMPRLHGRQFQPIGPEAFPIMYLLLLAGGLYWRGKYQCMTKQFVINNGQLNQYLKAPHASFQNGMPRDWCDRCHTASPVDNRGQIWRFIVP